MASPEKQPSLKSEFAGDPEIGELVEQFVRELPNRVETLRDAFQAGDGLRVRTLAHQLKGAAGGYGFPTIGRAAQAVDEFLRSNGTSEGALERVRLSVEELTDLCRRAATPSD